MKQADLPACPFFFLHFHKTGFCKILAVFLRQDIDLVLSHRQKRVVGVVINNRIQEV